MVSFRHRLSLFAGTIVALFNQVGRIRLWLGVICILVYQMQSCLCAGLLIKTNVDSSVYFNRLFTYNSLYNNKLAREFFLSQ